jgi:7-keto-8-aminopelargonate synthetase-like enzyme
MDIKPQFNNLDQKLASSIKLNEDNYLYFGGTAYLGIPQNKAFTNLFIEGIERFGLNNGTSRGNNVQLGIYNLAEDFMANKYGAAAALITSSGYLAAKLTVQAYAQQGEMRYAPNSHPALWLNNNVQHVNLAFNEWAAQTVAEINASAGKHWVLLSNSMNNLYPEVYDFSFIRQIDRQKSVTLIIDDSHGIGMLNGGNSVLQAVPEMPQVDVVVVASMAKALGVDAGVVLGSSAAISNLKQSDEFYGASPPAAAGLYAFVNANEIYRTAYQKLQDNIQLFTHTLDNESEWHFVNGFPVFLCKKPNIEQRLLQQNILISSFPYPDRHGAILNRIVLSSWHSEADIRKLVVALQG